MPITETISLNSTDLAHFSQSGAIVQICGWPGSGKSSLLWDLFHQKSSLYQKAIFIDAKGSSPIHFCLSLPIRENQSIFRVTNFKELMALLWQFQSSNEFHSILLCLDAIWNDAMLLDGDSHSETDDVFCVKGNRIASMMQLLYRISQKCNFQCQIFISNCMTRKGPALGIGFNRFFTHHLRMNMN